MGFDIHGRVRRLENAFRAIRESGFILPENRELILGFLEFLEAEGLSAARREAYARRLKVIGEYFPKPFREACREDVVALMRKIEARGVSAETVKFYKVVLRRFFKWLRGGEDYPPEVRWLRTGSKNERELPPEELLTERDVERLRRMEMERGELEERLRGLEAELSEAHARIKSLEALSEERLRRIWELEARLPEAEALEEMKRGYEERLSSLEEELEKTRRERDELYSQLIEASEELERLEEVKGLLLDWRDVIVELGRKLDVELIPNNIQAIIDERDRYKQRYEELWEEMEKKRRLTEDVLRDPAVQDWVETAKKTLRWFLDRRSEHGRILRKVVVTDSSYLFLPEEFPEVSVSPSTVASYLNDFALKGFVLKHEKAKMGRTAYSNALPLWVSQNVRRIRLDAPDEAIKAIVEELKSYVLKWI